MNEMTYSEIVNEIKNNGVIVSPRGSKTIEVLNATVVFESGLRINRFGMSESLAWLESLMFVAGIFDINLIKAVAPNANHNLYKYQSDYGPRCIQQFQRAQSILREDPFSRRAIVYLNNQDQPIHDQACTTSLQFFVRGNALHTAVNMRSWDIVFGLPMDIMMFSLVAQIMAATLGYQSGNIAVNAASLHLYDFNQNKAKESGEYEKFFIVSPKQYYGFDFLSIASYFKQNIREYCLTSKLPLDIKHHILHDKPLSLYYNNFER